MLGQSTCTLPTEDDVTVSLRADSLEPAFCAMRIDLWADTDGNGVPETHIRTVLPYDGAVTDISASLGSSELLRGNYAQVVWKVLRVPEDLEKAKMKIALTLGNGDALPLTWDDQTADERSFEAAFAASDVVIQEFQCLVRFR